LIFDGIKVNTFKEAMSLDIFQVLSSNSVLRVHLKQLMNEISGVRAEVLRQLILSLLDKFKCVILAPALEG
jgi:hypothetical protein